LYPAADLIDRRRSGGREHFLFNTKPECAE
jgi:hypothetical protein